MISFDKAQIGAGWDSIPSNVPIKTLDQFYSYTDGWKLGSYFTSQGQINPGKVAYRRPVTLRSQMALWPALVAKIWRCKVRPLFNSTK